MNGQRPLRTPHAEREEEPHGDREEYDWSQPGRAHLVGVAGAGMRALAEVLLGRGWHVSGSDPCATGIAGLQSRGLQLFDRHDAANLHDSAVVIHSDAVAPDNVELQEARRRGLPALTYFGAVAALAKGTTTIAVAGTHGKSTTTAMLAAILAEAGCDPTVFCGAAPLGCDSGGRFGRGAVTVVEACEYNANFLKLRPRLAAVLNIEPDHFDCYPTAAALQGAFRQFISQLGDRGFLLAAADCVTTQRLAHEAARCMVETFGLDAGDWTAHELAYEHGCGRFTIGHHDKRLVDVRLPLPGRHNVLNALAAAALAVRYGVTVEHVAGGLNAFRGLHRRLERFGAASGVEIVDDYAHHPTEITASLQTIREMFPGRRVVCVFQPHQALRTARLLEELAASCGNADLLAVADIFRAREGAAQPGEVTAADLARRMAGPAKLASHALADIATELQDLLTPGDVLVTLGAGDIRRLAVQIREERTQA